MIAFQDEMNLTENLKKPCRAKDFKHKCEMLSQFMRRQNTKVSFDLKK